MDKPQGDVDLHPFGGFLSTSPLSTKKRDSVLDLASNVIRDHFGVVVQAVADFMFTRPNARLSFSDILKNMQAVCKRKFHNERSVLVKRLKYLNDGNDSSAINSAYRYHLNQTIGSSAEGYVVDPDLIRAALLVLIQQNIANVHCIYTEGKNDGLLYKYSINQHRACMIVRYPRYVEHSKGLYGNTKAAFIIEELLLHGRLRTNDVILFASKAACATDIEESNENSAVEPTPSKSLKLEIFDILRRMIVWGHVEMVQPIVNLERQQEKEEQESYLDEKEKGKSKVEQNDEKNIIQRDDMLDALKNELDPVIFEEIKSFNKDREIQKIFIPGAVWRVNVAMFHSTIRSLILGRLVAERYGKKVQNAGSLITAALKFLAYKRHNSDSTTDNIDDLNAFYPMEVSKYLPATVLEAYKSKQGGLQTNLSRAFVTLSTLNWPVCIVEVESHRGHNKGGKFEVSTNSLIAHLRNRLTHQAIKDHLGEISARIIAVLESHGHLESEQIGEYAMLPAKEAREVSSTRFPQ